MISTIGVQAFALSFAEATESPHFEKSSFRVRKKIFATMDAIKNEVVVKLTAADQDIYCSTSGGAIQPVAGAWGKKGWTLVKLELIEEKLFKSVLTTSYITVAPKKLAAAYLDQ